MRKRYSVFLLLLLVAMYACKKTDHFYEELQSLPQIDYRTGYAYKSAYLVGDTLFMSGRLQPENNLVISVGGIVAPVVKLDSVVYVDVLIPRVAIIITEAMLGKARDIIVSSGGYRVTGTPVDVYPLVEPGSFSRSLKAATVSTFSNANNIFLYCRNGKGDVYYYVPGTRQLRHIKKDGTDELVYNLTGNLETGVNSQVAVFLAGGVDPKNQSLYFSAGVTSGGYRFCKIDLASKTLTILNRSPTAITAPFEGLLDAVNIMATGIYPDSNGNIYLAAGTGSGGTAIALYNGASRRVNYIFSRINAGPTDIGVPAGTPLNAVVSTSFHDFRISPDEKLAYFLGRNNINENGTVEIFDLDTRTSIGSFSTNNTTGSATVFDVTGAFASLQLRIIASTNAEFSFGYMPMPGKKLQVLLYQYINVQGGTNAAPGAGFPRWMTLDFNEQRSYHYAPGRFLQNSTVFQPTVNLIPRGNASDLLLNYDEEGYFYATANGKTVLIKTELQ